MRTATAWMIVLLFLLLAPRPAAADTVLLKDGTLIHGKIIRRDEVTVVIENEYLGHIALLLDGIVEIRTDTDKPPEGTDLLEWTAAVSSTGTDVGKVYDRDYNSIMFCPTPATTPKGEKYFRNFELIVLNFGYGVTDRLSISLGTFFPISSEMTMASFGMKYRIVNREHSPVGVAVAASQSFLRNANLTTANLIAGIGDRDKSLNVSMNRAFNKDGDSGWVFIAGCDYRVSDGVKFLFEYCQSSVFLPSDDEDDNEDNEDNDDDFDGLVNVGVRWFGSKMSFSLTGFRPLGVSGDLIAIPMAMFSVHW